MSNCIPWDITATDGDADPDGDGGKAAAGAGTQVVRRLIVTMLLTAAALDLTRCGLVMAAARHPAWTAGLVTAGLAAAALTARTARGCRAGRHWASWAALLIGVASAPQAAASGFRGPYLIPDSATASLGILLAITILATMGRIERRDTTENPSRHRHGSYASTQSAAAPHQPTIGRTPPVNPGEQALHSDSAPPPRISPG